MGDSTNGAAEELLDMVRRRLDAGRPRAMSIATPAHIGVALVRFMETFGRALTATTLRRASQGPRRPSWTLAQETVVCTLSMLAEELVREPAARVRATVDALQALTPVRGDVELGFEALGDVGALRITPRQVDRDAPLIVHLHGGGYVFGSPDTYAGQLAELAHRARAEVVAPYYSLAPEAHHPAAREDAESALAAVLEREDPRRVVLSGDSAGGGLALSCLRARRDGGGTMPAGVVLSSPWVDLAACHGSVVDFAGVDWADRAFLDHFASLYCGGSAPDDPSVSPGRCTRFAGLPPIRVQVGGVELFRTQTEVLVARARRAGVDAVVDVWPDMVHAFWALGPVFPAERAIAQLARWSRALVRGRRQLAKSG